MSLVRTTHGCSDAGGGGRVRQVPRLPERTSRVATRLSQGTARRVAAVVFGAVSLGITAVLIGSVPSMAVSYGTASPTSGSNGGGTSVTLSIPALSGAVISDTTTAGSYILARTRAFTPATERSWVRAG